LCVERYYKLSANKISVRFLFYDILAIFSKISFTFLSFRLSRMHFYSASLLHTHSTLNAHQRGRRTNERPQMCCQLGTHQLTSPDNSVWAPTLRGDLAITSQRTVTYFVCVVSSPVTSTLVGSISSYNRPICSNMSYTDRQARPGP
jgi:hypothetical protein